MKCMDGLFLTSRKMTSDTRPGAPTKCCSPGLSVLKKWHRGPGQLEMTHRCCSQLEFKGAVSSIQSHKKRPHRRGSQESPHCERLPILSVSDFSA